MPGSWCLTGKGNVLPYLLAGILLPVARALFRCLRRANEEEEKAGKKWVFRWSKLLLFLKSFTSASHFWLVDFRVRRCPLHSTHTGPFAAFPPVTLLCLRSGCSTLPVAPIKKTPVAFDSSPTSATAPCFAAGIPLHSCFKTNTQAYLILTWWPHRIASYNLKMLACFSSHTES